MAIIDTSNTIDSSIFLKAKLKGNMVGDNYYIENTQAKRDRDWEYRYNKVDIEEELTRQYYYTNEQVNFTPIEVVVNSVKNDKGEDLGTDWARVSFKYLYHPTDIGSRYRFSTYRYDDLTSLSEEEKHYNKSVWICVNRSPISAGNSSILRRCNSFITFVGSSDLSTSTITEYHQEPCIYDSEMKYVLMYSNMTIPIPQAECYLIMQCNYFTNCVKTNDRVVLGTNDLVERENNYVFKVKAVVKSNSNKTFTKDAQDLLESTSLIVLALDRDQISPNDNFETRVASCAPIYKVSTTTPTGEYYIEMEEGCELKVLQGEELTYTVHLKKDGEIVPDSSVHFNYSYDLTGIKEERQSVYYTFVNDNGSNSFKVKNRKQCKSSKFKVIVSCYEPGHEGNDTRLISQEYEIELGGFY